MSDFIIRDHDPERAAALVWHRSPEWRDPKLVREYAEWMQRFADAIARLAAPASPPAREGSSK